MLITVASKNVILIITLILFKLMKLFFYCLAGMELIRKLLQLVNDASKTCFVSILSH